MSKAKQHIRDTELRYKQGLGQNFIYDESLLEQLAEISGAGEADGVLEIGPGCGTLTGCLAPRVKRLIALEIDERLIPLLHGYLDKYENVTIVQGDVLKTNLHELTKPLGERFKVVANIPYYITTPLILLLLDSGLPIDSLALMVQKEVAEKMLAQPGEEGYGMLAVKCQYYGEPEIALDVPAAMFNPPPKVDSAFVVMPIRKEKPVQAYQDFFLHILSPLPHNRRSNGMTLSELRTKEVIDVQDGKRLGRVMDLEFCPTDSRITALVVPAETSFLQTLRGEKCGLVIPWQNIRRIGDDVILVSTADLNCHCPPPWPENCCK